ncbi:hypothetical protein GCM10027359_08700 [Marilutibacter aestuarii]
MTSRSSPTSGALPNLCPTSCPTSGLSPWALPNLPNLLPLACMEWVRHYILPMCNNRLGRLGRLGIANSRKGFRCPTSCPTSGEVGQGEEGPVGRDTARAVGHRRAGPPGAPAGAGSEAAKLVQVFDLVIGSGVPMVAGGSGDR